MVLTSVGNEIKMSLPLKLDIPLPLSLLKKPTSTRASTVHSLPAVITRLIITS